MATLSPAHRKPALDTPTGLRSEATRDISGALNALLADFFALLFYFTSAWLVFG